MNPAQFRLEGVSKVFGDQAALSEVSLDFKFGQHTAIIGPSGCGKTTLLRLLAGLDAPTAGKVLLDGRTLSASGRVLVPPHSRHIGLVFQDLALWPNLSALDNVLLGLPGLRHARSRVRAQALDALERCGIPDLAHARPGRLSGGQQQRVAIARAIAVRPKFLLLDEPFAGLDLVTKDALFDQIAALCRALGSTVILVTHDPAEVAQLCERVVVLERGQVVESGRLGELLQAPQSSLLRRFKAHQQM
ncbi:ABC transporter ATP-binding protein [Aerolutibacter ruishenii]|uniref:Iron(III) transport system ATP-binding protein n=1 Tax=Aerolutibacter ruishenii TaxID=686800 RepID=A0A562LV57_9GAMM|nr:ABC transporter ATP-binding protein [Lysobacter ruishenii]TWI11514.1 iron(III) transport system ATP-binding protein [Lysobacter ruishenii]